jgi:6-phospho-3-hexuloisomerase
MKTKICDLAYINKIRDNVLSVDPYELEGLLEVFKTHEVIVPVASGRSKHAINIPLSQATVMANPKTVINLEGPEFPWGSIDEAAPILEKRYRKQKILVLFASGSGETENTISVLNDLKTYMERTKSKKFTIAAITSKENSSLGKVAKEYGRLLILKGREENTRIEKHNSYAETGIMRDVFELGCCFLIQMIVNSAYYNLPAKNIFEMAENEFETVGRMIDESLKSEFYKEAIRLLQTRCHVFRNAKGTGDEVVRMTLIRLDHVKRAVGDDVYIINAPRPRVGDFQLSVSYSGNTSSVVNASKIFRKLGGYQFSIIGTKNSMLEKNSNSVLILQEKATSGQPRNFYMRAAFVASPLPIRLIEEFEKKGISLPEIILSYYHSVTE